VSRNAPQAQAIFALIGGKTMSVVLELASTEEKNVISTALAIGLVATEGIGEWKSTREVMLAVFERMRPDSQAQGAHLDAARELLETREQLGHVVEA
jgi:hypothetical protein